MAQKCTANVLLVDDDPDFLELLSARLQTRGMSVTTATSGEDALDISRHAIFDIIVIDLSMPGIDGIETIKRIKKVRPYAETIILTGHANITKSVQAIKVGAEDFLEKPVDMQILLNKICAAQERTIANYQKQYQQEAAEIMKKRSW